MNVCGICSAARMARRIAFDSFFAFANLISFSHRFLTSAACWEVPAGFAYLPEPTAVTISSYSANGS